MSGKPIFGLGDAEDMSSSHRLMAETVEGLDLAIRLAREQVAADPVLRRVSEDMRRLLEHEPEAEPRGELGARVD